MLSTKAEYIDKDNILILDEQLNYQLILFTEHILYVILCKTEALKKIKVEICK